MKIHSFCAVPLFLSMFFVPSVVCAAEFTVDSETDAVDASIGDGTCAAASGKCTLRAAIQEANTTAAEDSIVLPKGYYVLSIAGISEDASATGDLDITESVTITGSGAGEAIVDADQVDRIFHILGDNTTASFEGIGMRNGIADTAGGGVFHENNGTLSISNCAVYHNVASQFGGGVYTETSGDVVVMNSRISGNTSDQQGGGLVNFGAGTLKISNVTIEGNYADDRGGGVDNNATGTVDIDNSTISGNITLQTGGGISNGGAGTVTVDDSMISFNAAGMNGTSEGGGVHNASSGSVEISNSTVKGNSAPGGGGGILNAAAGAVAVSSSLIAYNATAASGSGLRNDSSGTMTVINSTISNNVHTTTGGSVTNVGTGETSLSGCTVTANDGENGPAGLYQTTGTLSITNTIVAQFGLAADCGGTITTNGGNLDSDGSCIAASSNDFPNENPRLYPLADNGGKTLTHALHPTSPALDAGLNGNCQATDQRGFARPVDGDDDGTAACDIGAFEYGLDCNENGVVDSEDISTETSVDCDNNSIPDECQIDTDGDNTIDACEDCDEDPLKQDSGICGCGVADSDDDNSGVVDCLLTEELNVQLSNLLTQIKKVRSSVKNRSKVQGVLRGIETSSTYFDLNESGIDLTPGTTSADFRSSLSKAKKKTKALKRSLGRDKSIFGAKKRGAKKAVTTSHNLLGAGV